MYKEISYEQMLALLEAGVDVERRDEGVPWRSIREIFSLTPVLSARSCYELTSSIKFRVRVE